MPDESTYYELTQDNDEHDLLSLIGPTTYPSHFHKKPEVTYMVKGQCVSEINHTRYVAEPDDILFVSEYNPHSYHTTDDALRYVFLADNNARNDAIPLFNNKTFPCLLDNKIFNREKILPILNEMLAYQRLSSPLSVSKKAQHLILKGYTDILYGLFFMEYSDRLITVSKQNEAVASILAYIDEHYAEDITLEGLAGTFAYNKFYFSKLFNSCIGVNFSNYVNNVRIQKFVEKYDPNMRKNLLSLAFDVGFKSMPSFYRAFSRVYHCTPGEYFNLSE